MVFKSRSIGGKDIREVSVDPMIAPEMAICMASKVVVGQSNMR